MRSAKIINLKRTFPQYAKDTDNFQKMSDAQINALFFGSQKKSLFITGSRGTGKTTAARFLCEAFLSLRISDICVGTPTQEGLIGWKDVAITSNTLFVLLGLHFVNREMIETMSAGNIVGLLPESVKKRWRDMKMLIVDDVHLLREELWIKMDEMARIMRFRRDASFGGLQIIAVGDFMQSAGYFVKTYLFETNLWVDTFSVEILCRNVFLRDKVSPDWKSILEKFRNQDHLSAAVIEELEEYSVTKISSNLETLARELFDDQLELLLMEANNRFHSISGDTGAVNFSKENENANWELFDQWKNVCLQTWDENQALIHLLPYSHIPPHFLSFYVSLKKDQVIPSKLCFFESQSEKNNQIMYDNIIGETERVFEANLKFNVRANNPLLPKIEKEFASLLRKNAVVPFLLKLKPGCQVIWMDPEKDYGKRGVVVGFEDTKSVGSKRSFAQEVLPIVKWDTGQVDVVDVCVWEYHKFIENKTVTVLMTQIPLALAWSVCISRYNHPFMTVSTIEIDLKTAFDEGQMYAYLSRVRTKCKVVFTNFDSSFFNGHAEKKNEIVHRYYANIYKDFLENS